MSWEKVKEFLLKNVARLVLLIVAIFPIVLTVLLVLAKFNKAAYRDQAIREHNREMREEHRDLRVEEAQRMEEIRKELIDKEAKEVWKLWSETFKRPLG